jgi:hypothetical protein
MFYLGRTQEPMPMGRKPATDEAVTLGKAQTLPGTRFYFKKPHDLELRHARGSVELPVALQSEDVRRWRLASTAMDRYDIKLDSPLGPGEYTFHVKERELLIRNLWRSETVEIKRFRDGCRG